MRDFSIVGAKNLFLLILAFSLGLLRAFTEDFASVIAIACHILEAYFYQLNRFLEVFARARATLSAREEEQRLREMVEKGARI